MVLFYDQWSQIIEYVIIKYNYNKINYRGIKKIKIHSKSNQYLVNATSMLQMSSTPKIRHTSRLFEFFLYKIDLKIIKFGLHTYFKWAFKLNN